MTYPKPKIFFDEINKIKIFKFDAIDSTQNISKCKNQIASLNPDEWRLYITETQHQGRGTYNRKWVSPPFSNIYATYSIFVPTSKISNAQRISQVASLAVAEVLRKHYHLDAKFKWINDILISNKKISGILTELEGPIQIQEQKGYLILIGIGLNVNMTRIECDSLEQPATSISVEKGYQINKDKVLSQLSYNLKNNINMFLEGNINTLHKSISSILYTYNNEVIVFDTLDVNSSNRIISGVIQGIDKQGRLILQTQQGEEIYVKGRILGIK